MDGPSINRAEYYAGELDSMCWLDPGEDTSISQSTSSGLDGAGSCKDGYRLDDIAGQSRTAIDYDLQGLADMVNGER
jgi:hypothetical protein